MGQLPRCRSGHGNEIGEEIGDEIVGLQHGRCGERVVVLRGSQAGSVSVVEMCELPSSVRCTGHLSAMRSSAVR